MKSNKSIIEKNLMNLLRSKSVSALIAIAQRQDIHSEEVSQLDPTTNHWMSLVSVFGENIHITFKVQFTTNMARMFAQQAFKSIDHGISDSQSKDFIREFCNMTAGQIKNNLVQNNVQVGVSLPLLCRGFDDMFFALPYTENNELSGVARWKLVCPSAIVFCSAVIEVGDNFQFAGDFNETEQDSGEVEFL